MAGIGVITIRSIGGAPLLARGVKYILTKGTRTGPMSDAINKRNAISRQKDFIIWLCGAIINQRDTIAIQRGVIAGMKGDFAS